MKMSHFHKNCYLSDSHQKNSNSLFSFSDSSLTYLNSLHSLSIKPLLNSNSTQIKSAYSLFPPLIPLFHSLFNPKLPNSLSSPINSLKHHQSKFIKTTTLSKSPISIILITYSHFSINYSITINSVPTVTQFFSTFFQPKPQTIIKKKRV
jgi:hypothetical protein